MDANQQLVWVDVTHHVAVRVDLDGWEFRGVVERNRMGPAPATAAEFLADQIASWQWGGHCALGGLPDPWGAADVRISETQMPLPNQHAQMIRAHTDTHVVRVVNGWA